MNSGLTKLQAEKETHNQLHRMASGAYPVLENAPPEQFGKALGAAEVALGSALLAPIVVGDGLAGLALTSFAGGLIGLYMKTSGMRQEGSVRPSREGVGLAKDTWLAGIGLTLLASSVGSRRDARHKRKAREHATESRPAKSSKGAKGRS